MLHAPNGEPLPRVLAYPQARRLGYTEGRVRTELRCGRWEQLVRGVYLTRGDVPRRADWIRAGLELAGPGAALSGWDAARAYGLGSDRAPVETVLILAAAGDHRRCGRSLIRPSRRAFTLNRSYLPDAGSVPCVHAARAVADTALVYRSLPPVRALVTSAVQQQLCTVGALVAELEGGPRNGSAHLRRAVEDVSGGSASLSEAELADLLVGVGLPAFEQNVPLIDPDGRHVATADVLWRELRAILEVDSREHHFLEPKWRGTMRRHNLLTRYALAVTHYPPVDIRDRPAAVAAEVEAWLRARAAELRVSFPPQPQSDAGSPLYLR